MFSSDDLKCVSCNMLIFSNSSVFANYIFHQLQESSFLEHSHWVPHPHPQNHTKSSNFLKFLRNLFISPKISSIPFLISISITVYFFINFLTLWTEINGKRKKEDDDVAGSNEHMRIYSGTPNMGIEF